MTIGSFFYIFGLSKMRDQLTLSIFFELRPCLAFAFLTSFFLFLHLGPLTLSNLYSIFSQISYLHISLLFYAFLCPQVVKDHFTLGFIINSGSLVLFSKNSI